MNFASHLSIITRSTLAQSREHLHLSSSATSFITCMRKNQNHHSQQATPQHHANNFQSKKNRPHRRRIPTALFQAFQASCITAQALVCTYSIEHQRRRRRSRRRRNMIHPLRVSCSPFAFFSPSILALDSGNRLYLAGLQRHLAKTTPNRKFLSRPFHPMQSPEISHIDGSTFPVTNIRAKKTTTPVSSARSRVLKYLL